MADNKSRGLTVKVDVDVSEALTGLKALQREAKAAVRELREVENAKVSGRKIERLSNFILSKYPREIGMGDFGESAVDVAIRLLGGDK
jgi:hypothetical protein